MAIQRRGVERKQQPMMSIFYPMVGPTLSVVLRRTHDLVAAQRVLREFKEWEAEYGFDYRCQTGHPNLTDRERLADGVEPDLERECPEPAGWREYDHWAKSA